MPEIAEVARITHFLRQHLVGKRISKVVAADDSNVFGKVGTTGAEFQKAVTGKQVVSAGSQGKYFWITLDTPPHPVMHFGMTGWIHIRSEQTGYTRYIEKTKNDKEEWPPRFWKFQLETDSDPKVEVAFTDARRFGRVRLVHCPGDDIRKHSPLKENGPDPVVDKDLFTEDYLKQKMRSRHVPIKALLLDQAMISGIGNWVGDEIMYHAKLHPEQYSDDFSDEGMRRLFKSIMYVCDTAVGHLGDSDKFPEDWLFNHRKKDAATTLPTGEKIVFITVGGRTSCVVPSVQKKTGKTTMPDTKEEREALENGAESKYFEEKTPKKGGKAKAIKKEEEQPAPKTVRPAKRKAVKEEVEEAAPEEVAPIKRNIKNPRKGSATDAEPVDFSDTKTKKSKPEAKSVDPTPELGRRRSGRLRAKDI
ncbi:Formamidopyrimidine-DNA glycosylase N-terminal domain-containing protein [Apiospora phragmitis]|uniref:Formamidopyrimidine-DNA glycosylase N-terminal domain-containing protein n=1 Tax=Apiospora phragmitis TaxID=2905665 RepID=A0ABR1SWT8_9PEZI